MIDQISKDKIEALKLARKLIKIGKESFLCKAFESITTGSHAFGYTASSLRHYIQKCIVVYTFNDWVWTNVDCDAGWETITQYRLQWLDWMVYCLENPQMSLEEINRTFVPNKNLT